MSDRVPDEPFFGVPQELPRGPHSLSRAEVASSQRLRLMRAIVDAVAERGYARATIDDITRRAGVSPRTFYEHFEDQLDCFLAAYDVFASVLLERVGAALAVESSWEDFVTATLTAYLGSLASDLAVARAFLLEMNSAGPVARRRRREANEVFARALAARYEVLRARDASLGAVTPVAYLGIVHAVHEFACDELERDEPQLLALVPQLVRWITAMTRGADT